MSLVQNFLRKNEIFHQLQYFEIMSTLKENCDPIDVLEYQKKLLLESQFICRRTFVNTKFWIQNLADDLIRRLPAKVLQSPATMFGDMDILKDPQNAIKYLESLQNNDPYQSPVKTAQKQHKKATPSNNKRQVRKPPGGSKSSRKVKVVNSWRRG